MRTLIRPLALAALMASASLMACNKSNQEDAPSETQAEQLALSADAAFSEDAASTVFDDVFDNAMASDADAGLGMNIGVFGGRISRTDSTNPPPQRCFTVTVSPTAPTVFPKTVTVDFGNTGCLGRDGKVRKGKMITVFSGPMRQPQSSATTTFQNFWQDSFRVEGTHMVTNVSTSNNRSFRTQVQNGKVSKSATQYITWNKDKTWLQTEGNGTPNLPADDVFSITGSANGSRVNGSKTNTWRMQIASPLIRRFNCRWIVQGVRNLTRNNVAATLNYGNGQCDIQAVVTVNGQTRTITLP